MSDTKVKVAVRVRPMNRREIELSTKCVVEMEENQTVLHPPPSNAKAENRSNRGERGARGAAPGSGRALCGMCWGKFCGAVKFLHRPHFLTPLKCGFLLLSNDKL
ncbi:Kinesin-like protein KIF13A [Triplophysa tibetana]|uniref:Kinesin-like protein KIF13A n=1 Tax=Triplophysa tibetana TaxID=1572043 RepID=A0A5A9N234_9TELE|nr:Kinesin-like protein KIF13A [Triplophysa tibetana]